MKEKCTVLFPFALFFVLLIFSSSIANTESHIVFSDITSPYTPMPQTIPALTVFHRSCCVAAAKAATAAQDIVS